MGAGRWRRKQADPVAVVICHVQEYLPPLYRAFSAAGESGVQSAVSRRHHLAQSNIYYSISLFLPQPHTARELGVGPTYLFTYTPSIHPSMHPLPQPCPQHQNQRTLNAATPSRPARCLADASRGPRREPREPREPRGQEISTPFARSALRPMAKVVAPARAADGRDGEICACSHRGKRLVN